MFVSFRTMSFMSDAPILGFIVAAFFFTENYMYPFSFMYNNNIAFYPKRVGVG